MRRTLILILGLGSAFILLYNGCKHEPEEYIPNPPDPDTTSCDTANVTYNGTIYPILDQYCISSKVG